MVGKLKVLLHIIMLNDESVTLLSKVSPSEVNRPADRPPLRIRKKILVFWYKISEIKDNKF